MANMAAILVGALAGGLGLAPLCVLLAQAWQRSKMHNATVAAGVMAIVLSFSVMALAGVMVRVAASAFVPAFACAMVSVFLAGLGILAVKASRAMHAGGANEGDDG